MRRGAASTAILISLWVLAAGILVGSYWIITVQTATAQRLGVLAARAEDAVLAGDWATAAAQTRELRRAWENTRRIWALHTEHADMDHISDYLIEAEALIETQQTSAVAALRRARHRIADLPGRDRIRPENLF